ncbi:MAG: metallophosphoesterase [Gemmatimonadetes bacterium]|nr:metallophosphoesterase [Gemmatimonadota bacterium]
MILAHLSDLHLGHRAFDRWERGVNVRERDVAQSVQRAFDAVIERRPDLVIITGDVFDRPDPSPGALVTLTRGLEALHSALPDTPVVMVAGARDTPRRSADAGALAALDAFPNVEAATVMPRSISYARRSLHVLLIPHTAVLRGPQPLLEPDPRMERNVLVTCGRVAHGEGPGLQVDPAEWDYVALGSDHTHRVVGPGVAYAGSLERVGSAPWREAGEEKGFVTVELPGAEIRFHPLPGRPVVALAPSRAPTGDPERLRARLAEVVREIPGGIDRKVVRVQLRGPSPSDLVALQGLLPELTEAAVHLSVGVERTRTEPWTKVDPLERARAALPPDAPPEAGTLLERVLGDEGPRGGRSVAGDGDGEGDGDGLGDGLGGTAGPGAEAPEEAS